MLYFLHVVIILSSIYISTGQPPKLLQAFIHIGPPKTGSSYIQEVLYDNIKLLDINKFYLPKLNDKTLPYAKFQMDIVRHSNSNKSHTFFDNYFNFVEKKKGNIIMSSEAFTGNKNANTNFPLYIENLKKKLTLNATVIMIYREELSRSISICNQNVKKDRDKNSFVCLNNKVDYGVGGFYINMLDKYSKIFGLSNIKIIDYYGAFEAKKDLAYILICEIMGILCDELKSLNKENKKLVNSSRSLSLSALFILFEEYAKINNCKINTNFKSNKAYNYFNESLSNELIGTKWEGLNNLPLLKFDFSNKLKETIQLDRELRESKYSSSIIYGNRQASLDAAHKSIVNYSEIDANKVKKDPLLKIIFESLLIKYVEKVKNNKIYGTCITNK